MTDNWNLGAAFPEHVLPEPKTLFDALTEWHKAFSSLDGSEQGDIERTSEPFFRKMACEAFTAFSQAPPDARPVLLLLELLDMLVGHFSREDLWDLIDRALDAWPSFDSDRVREQCALLLCSTAYETRTRDAPKEDAAEQRRRVFAFLKGRVEDSSTADESRFKLLEFLLVQAAAFEQEDIDTMYRLLATPEADWMSRYIADQPCPPYLARIITEFIGQYSRVQLFHNVPVACAASTPFVTVMSRKGGVGKTIILMHLALHLAREGKRVALVDFDYGGPSLSYFFQVEAAADLVTIEQGLNPGDKHFEADVSAIIGKATNLQNLIPKDNLLICQMGPLSTVRQQFVSSLHNPTQLAETQEATWKFFHAVADLADIVFVDNHPGVFGLSLVSFGYAYQRFQTSHNSLTVFVTSSDISDVGALQVELDLFTQFGLLADAYSFRWVVNKVPADAEIQAVYRDSCKLAHALQNTPALKDVPHIPDRQLVLRYMNLPKNPLLAEYVPSLGKLLSVRPNARNVNFGELLDGAFAKEEAMTELRKLVRDMVGLPKEN